MSGDDHTALPLVSWQPPACALIPFPMINRVGKIRDVAAKLLDKQTDRHAEYYCKQVTDGLSAQFSKLGLSEALQDEQIGAFWTKVNQEVVRLRYRHTGSTDPRGAA
ncbi:hypothetical protein C6558_03430 [Ensifer sp. NM-2]|uniref:DUF6074 family protein n=1 Tax=Ensifer sp. NM-2 TaxID=2109730 RepID=UPI000D1355D4|nr:DUF6074 family protein [Ensifer sp. NM-2]PSS67076.1 hypothetical protein C6558_03430 [Ensifer sp. NM-2]